MVIDSEDFNVFFNIAYNKNVNELRCFECGKTLTEKEDLTGLTCTNSHEIGYLEYMTQYASFLNEIAQNAEINGTFYKSVTLPTNIIYCGNEIVFCEKEILRK